MVLSILLIIISSLNLTINEASLYSTTKKRTDKILNKYWEGEKFKIQRLELELDQPELYTVHKEDSEIFAYILFGEAPSKVDSFIYMVIFNTETSIEKVSVLLYKENYGGEIASNRFLKQFVGKSNGLDMEINKDIDGISGATISVRSITRAVRSNSKSFSDLISTIQ